MDQELPLGLNHPKTKAALLNYASRLGENSISQLTGRGYYVRFAEGRSEEEIAAEAGVSRPYVANIFHDDFRHEVFHDMTYRAYCELLERQRRALILPENEAVKLVAEAAEAAGMIVRPVITRSPGGQMRTRIRTITVNHEECSIHTSSNPSTFDIRVKTLGKTRRLAVIDSKKRVHFYRTVSLLAHARSQEVHRARLYFEREDNTGSQAAAA